MTDEAARPASATGALPELPRLTAFSPDFLWGTATASYQIEGAVTEGGRAPSIWDTFSHSPGRTWNGDTGDEACDHYHRWRDDVTLMRELGLVAYRFSVAWPRILPEGVGRANSAGLDFYDRLVEGLLEAGIRPFVTLYHWDLPQALEERGGWRSPEVVGWFADYAGLVGDRLGDRVRDWITLNEPQVFTFLGHASGEHAPGMRDWAAALRAAHHTHLAHAAAAEALHAARQEARVGMAIDIRHLEPATGDPVDVEAVRRLDGMTHRWFLDPVFGRGYPADAIETFGSLLDGIELRAVDGIAPPDFLGVNYYTRQLMRDEPKQKPLRTAEVQREAERTEMGWEVYPPGLREVLLRIYRDYRPSAVVVSENGAAFDDRVGPDGEVLDLDRCRYLAAHIGAMGEALAAGVPLQGYFAWSLIDNFEWAQGYSKRFGLVRVDYPTQRRTVKASGHWYASLIRAWREQSSNVP